MHNNQKSKAAHQRALKIFPGGVNSPVRAFRSVAGEPFYVARGSGAYLIDLDGNRYVDYINSWGPLVLGHADPDVIEAIKIQSELGTSFGTSHEKESELAELIQKFFPSLEQMRFVNSGTEAGMSVLRLARAYTKRNKIVKFSGCYHGHVDSLLVQAGSGVATLALPDSPGVLQSVAADTVSLEYNNCNAVADLFAKSATDIAAVIVEPVVGNAGFIAPKQEFLNLIRSLTSKHGALLIFDEVMTGFRVALGGAQALFKVTPDLSMLGKVIGGGLPVGAFGGRREIMQLVAPAGAVYQAGTLSGNPLAMSAGIATLKKWSAPGIFDKVSESTRILVESMRTAAAAANLPFCVDYLGSMFGFFFQSGPVHSYEQAKRSDLERFKRFFWACLEQGIYFAPSQFEAGFVSYAHVGEPIQTTCQVVERVMSEIK